MEKKIWVLSVDFDGGDGADLFKIPENGSELDEWKERIGANFTELLFASYPPPKVEVKALTPEEWAEAERVGAGES